MQTEGIQLFQQEFKRKYEATINLFSAHFGVNIETVPAEL